MEEIILVGALKKEKKVNWKIRHDKFEGNI